MFWDRLIPRQYYIKQEVCTVELFLGEKRDAFYTCIKNRKGSLLIEESGSMSQGASLPLRIKKNKIPLVLILNGSGVAYRKVIMENDAADKLEELLRKNLPALDSNAFYTNVYKQNDGSGFLSFCRKEQADAVIKTYVDEGYEIANVHIGVPVAIGLQPLWGEFSTIETSTHQLELRNNNIEFINQIENSVNQKPYQLDGMKFTSFQALGLAASVSYFMHRDTDLYETLGLSDYKAKHTEKNKFRFLMVACVALAFTVTFGNVIYYTIQFDKNNKTDNELGVYQGKHEKINQLLEKYQKNKGLIENAGVLNKNKLSEYADRIGLSMPDEILLSEMYFNPRKTDDEGTDSLVKFENKQLILKGQCAKSLVINEWVNVLKLQKFVKDVNLEKYVYSNEGLQPNFEIKISTE